jgi:hypothetical protein
LGRSGNFARGGSTDPWKREFIGMKQRSLETLYSYWNQVRAGRLAPQRLEIEPSRIASILSETFMLERIDASTYLFRLAGTRLCDLFGSELRGKNFLEGWSEADRLVLERLLATLSEHGAVAVLDIEGSRDGRRRLDLEAMLLPLLHGGNRISRIIGVMSAATDPHWLAEEPLRSRHLKRHQVVWPDGRPHSVLERAGGRAPFRPLPAGLRLLTADRNRFRVLQGGRTAGKPDKR